MCGAIPAGTNADVSLAYAYDFLSRLAYVTNGSADITAYAYDAVGNLGQTTYSNGLKHVYTYNALNRLKTLGLTNGSGTQIHSYSYGLNLAGYLTNVVEMSGGAQTRSNSYDYDHSYTGSGTPARVYRLTREQIFNGSLTALGGQTNVYDLNGNRTTRQVAYSGFTLAQSFTNQTFAFDRRDQIDGDSLPNNANTNYDANGNTLVDAGSPTADLYNAENRLINRNGTLTFGYDADGNRIAKTNGGTVTYYLMDDLNPTGYAQVMAEYSAVTGGTAPSVTYSLGSQLISQNRSGTVSYYGLDGQGSVRVLVNATTSTTATDTYDYDAWGMLLDGTGSTSNSVRYTGQYWDSDLGMNYQRARFYKPNLGRFWTMDTCEGDNQDPLSLHRYVYCQGNPINGADPSGLFDAGSEIETANLGQGIGVGVGAVAAQAERAVLMRIAKVVTTTAVLYLTETEIGEEPPLPPTFRPPKDDDDSQDAYVVRAGVTTPQQLQAGTALHLAVPGLTGFSVQSARGKTISDLAKAGKWHNKQISVSTVKALQTAGELIGYPILVVKSPGQGFHCTVAVPYPLPDLLASILSGAFVQQPNPFPIP